MLYVPQHTHTCQEKNEKKQKSTGKNAPNPCFYAVILAFTTETSLGCREISHKVGNHSGPRNLFSWLPFTRELSRQPRRGRPPTRFIGEIPTIS